MRLFLFYCREPAQRTRYPNITDERDKQFSAQGGQMTGVLRWLHYWHGEPVWNVHHPRTETKHLNKLSNSLAAKCYINYRLEWFLPFVWHNAVVFLNNNPNSNIMWRYQLNQSLMFLYGPTKSASYGFTPLLLVIYTPSLDRCRSVTSQVVHDYRLNLYDVSGYIPSSQVAAVSCRSLRISKLLDSIDGTTQ